MSCKPPLKASRPLYTRASTSDAQFIPFFQADANEAALVKMSYLLEGTGIECRRAARYSNDKFTWTAEGAFGPLYETAGSRWGTTYYTLITEYRWVEFGLVCRNASGFTGLQSGFATAKVEFRDDPFTSFGDLPTTWGTLEGGLTRTSAFGRVSYFGASAPYGDVFDSPSSPWSLTVVGATAGDAAGPAAWRPDNTPVFIGYDDTTREWNAYDGNKGVLPGSTPVVGSPHALARVSVTAGGVATFEVSFDGFNWVLIYTETATWPWRGYLVLDATVYTVARELRG